MATIKGKWLFNETLTTLISDKQVFINVNYTTETYYNKPDNSYPDIEKGWHTVSGTQFIFFNGVNHYFHRRGDIFCTSKNMIADNCNVYNTEYGWYCFDAEYGSASYYWDISPEEISKRIRIFDFGETEQVVTKGFYDWLILNAIVYHEQPETPIVDLKTFLKNIANAIRAKKGTTLKINAQEFENEILTITNDDTNVIPDGYIKPVGTYNIFNNGKYNVASYEYANVAIPEYTGVYELKPKTTTQKIETKNKVLSNDLEVRAISYAEATNNANGITVSIASD